MPHSSSGHQLERTLHHADSGPQDGHKREFPPRNHLDLVMVMGVSTSTSHKGRSRVAS